MYVSMNSPPTFAAIVGDQLVFTCKVLQAGSVQFAAEPIICRASPLGYLSGNDVGDQRHQGIFRSDLVGLDRNPPNSNFTVILTGTPTEQMTLMVLCGERVSLCAGVEQKNVTINGKCVCVHMCIYVYSHTKCIPGAFVLKDKSDISYLKNSWAFEQFHSFFVG